MKKDEINIIKQLLKDSREAFVKAEEKEQILFQVLGHYKIDLSKPTNAENATNLEEAISCFLQYGEYNIKCLLKEIENSKQLK